MDRTAVGEYYGILVPRGRENPWVAGRCNSSDIKLHGAIRDQPACFMMGGGRGHRRRAVAQHRAASL
jgi:hypothetical protein